VAIQVRAEWNDYVIIGRRIRTSDVDQRRVKRVDYAPLQVRSDATSRVMAIIGFQLHGLRKHEFVPTVECDVFIENYRPPLRTRDDEWESSAA